jgi:predicted nucleic acid-binding protein
VALVVDASALYAQANRREPAHEGVARVLRQERETLITTELAVAEADCPILERLGLDAELAFLEDLASGTFSVECLTRPELWLALDAAVHHRHLRTGLADASLVVLAHRFGTKRIATPDERAFRAASPLDGGSFTILPADVRLLPGSDGGTTE